MAAAAGAAAAAASRWGLRRVVASVMTGGLGAAGATAFYYRCVLMGEGDRE